MESSLVIKQFAAGEQEDYGGLAGITFRATSNPEAQAPENLADRKSTRVRNHMLESQLFKEAFVPKKKTKGPKPKGEIPGVEILRCSFRTKGEKGYNDKFGLTGAILEAYSRHHGLVLKPDSFWQVILIQFGYYVNANAEALRDRLVDFQGQKILKIVMPPNTLEGYNYADFVNQMVDDQISKNIKDPSLVEWLIPSFTTTSPDDRVTAGVSIMSALQTFFRY